LVSFDFLPKLCIICLRLGGFEKLIGTFEVFGDPFSGDLSIAVLVTFNVLMVLIWATDKVCLFYRNKRPGRKTEKFTILGEYEGTAWRLTPLTIIKGHLSHCPHLFLNP